MHKKLPISYTKHFFGCQCKQNNVEYLRILTKIQQLLSVSLN